ncbi:MAG: hypothetical protein Q7T01_01240, partial [bacterium]|nr:hypothetical protein [bacterium]
MLRTMRAIVLRFRGPWGTGRILAFTGVAVVIMLVATMPMVAHAAPLSDTIAHILGLIISTFTWFIGLLLLGAIAVLTTVAQYNDFLNSAAITTGWVIIRDVANMFFIVILLVISFATILGLSNYKYQQMLPQLIVAAILINFSKMIAGIFIDISQVVMLTFVNGFAASAGGNFASMFQIEKMFSIKPSTTGDGAVFGTLQAVGGYLLGFFLMVMALVIVIVMIAMLAYRIVMLWALVVFSPLPYILRVLPGKGSSYANQWWSKFTSQLIAGPVLAFFLWLTLTSLGSGNVGADVSNDAEVKESKEETGQIAEEFKVGQTEAGSTDSLISFVIAMAMLGVGLKFAAESGAAGAGLAKTAQAGLAKYGKKYAYNVSGARAIRSVGARAGQSDTAQKALAWGAATGVPLVSGLSTAGLMASQKAKKEREGAAKKQIEALKKHPEALRARIEGGSARRLAGRMAGGATDGVGRFAGMVGAKWLGTKLRGSAEGVERTVGRSGTSRWTAGGHYEREAAKEMMPSLITDAKERGAVVRGMDDKAVSGLSATEVRRLSALGADQGGLSEDQRRHLLERGSTAQKQAAGLRSNQRSLDQVKREKEHKLSNQYGEEEKQNGNTDWKREAARRAHMEVEKMSLAALGVGRPELAQDLSDRKTDFMGGATIASVSEGAPPTHNDEMYDATHDKVRQHEREGKNFFDSDDYRKNKSAYLDRRTYNNAKSTKDDQRKDRDAHGENRVNGVVQLQAQAKPGGNLGSVRMVMDFGSSSKLAALREAGQSNVRLNELGTDDKKEVLQDLRQMMERDGRDRKEIVDIMSALDSDEVGGLELRDAGGKEEERAHAVATVAARGQLDDAATKNVEVYKKLEDEFRAMMASSPEM